MKKKKKADVYVNKLGKGCRTFGKGIFNLARNIDKILMENKQNTSKRQVSEIKKLKRDIKIAKLKNELKKFNKRDDPWRF